jgi:hypothetical protein
VADSRTLKLSVLADVDGLKKALSSGEKNVQSFGSKVADFGKKAAVAFAAAAAAAAAYAGKLAIDGVKSAIADEKAQESLRRTLENVTGATDETVRATEDYISVTALAVGVADDELRPSLDRLVRATGDVTKAQKLQALALDVSAGTGKSLQTVTEALSKAQEGNLSGLTRLGVGITAAEAKTLSFDQVTAKLGQTFTGQASAAANTFQGRMDRLSVAFDEAKEAVGFALLPILERLLSFITGTILPVVQRFSDSFGGAGGLAGNITMAVDVVKRVAMPIFEGAISLFNRVKDAIMANQDSFQRFGKLLKDYVAPIVGNVLGGALKALGIIAQGVINIIGKAADFITTTVELAIKGINALIKAYNAIPLLPNIPTINAPSTNVQIPASPSIRANERAMSVPSPTVSGGGGAGAVTNNITVNGAIDSESTARQIVKVLNESALRGTGGAAVLSRPTL